VGPEKDGEVMDEELKKKVAWSADGGGPLACMRPAKPEVAIALARAALSSQDSSAIEHLLEALCGPYTFAGWLCKADPNKLLDNEGKEVDEVKPGDTFVTFGEKPS
jgi:hypothetical protein